MDLSIRRSAALASLIGLSFACASPSPPGAPLAADRSLRPSGLVDVLLVGNSVEGSVSVIEDRTLRNVGAIDVIPDIADRMREINGDPQRQARYALILQAETVKRFEPVQEEAQPGTRFVDDLFLSPDGTTLYVSRGNLGDVAAFDLAAGGFPMIWRTTVDGFKADHASISPDGATIVVSASASSPSVAQILDTAHGGVTGSFLTGLVPHQNDFSVDGKHIYNGSIGALSLPYAQNAGKGPRTLTLVDASTLQVLRQYPFDFGVRPTVITRNEAAAYLQLSYLNGFIKFDLAAGKTLATHTEPLSTFAKANYLSEDDYPHNSAHHGLALSADETRLCDCGTIDNSVSIVSARDMTLEKTFDNIGLVPYWATTSADGRRCFVSLSGDNKVAVVDYEGGAAVKYVGVGKYPQRNRLGQMPRALIDRIAAAQRH